MCLELTHWANGTIRDDRNIPKKVFRLRRNVWVDFWKVYLKTKFGELRSPYHPRLLPICRDGWHISNRFSKMEEEEIFVTELTSAEIKHREIDRGIHVYTTKTRAKRWAPGYPIPKFIVEKVRARRGDIIAYEYDGSEAVCTRVYVPSADKTKKVRHGRVR
jgi:hypothetical protein